MDHSHNGGEMDDMCSMAMLFHTDYHNLCIVFDWWHIRSLGSFVVSLVFIVLLGVGYEAVREISQRVELGYPTSALFSIRRDDSQLRNGPTTREKSTRAFMYAVQVFYSFFIMLVFMTYNFWVMLAVAVGAFAGYLLFGGSTASKSVACH